MSAIGQISSSNQIYRTKRKTQLKKAVKPVDDEQDQVSYEQTDGDTQQDEETSGTGQQGRRLDLRA